MQVRTNLLEVDTVQIVIRFDPRFVEVEQIETHADNPIAQFTLPRPAAPGKMNYASASSQGANGAFPLATITLRGKEVTPEGLLTELVFLVDDDDETAAFADGVPLLKSRENFTGAWIRVTP